VYQNADGLTNALTGREILFDTVEVDTHGMYNGAGLFTIPEDGVYSVMAQWTYNFFGALAGADITFGMAIANPPYPATSAQGYNAVINPIADIGLLVFPSVDMALERFFSAGTTFGVVASSGRAPPIPIAGNQSITIGGPLQFPGATYCSIRRIS
jgi:hypothetical protein